jgi:glycosyltransferase involved in cell wall biosynthesis
VTDPTAVSVLIAVRDGARYLPEALASVAAQAVAVAEVIVIDDGSTDGSGDVAVRSLPTVRLLTQAPTGYAAAVNAGVSAATGPLLAFLDADDLWTSDSLACRVERLAQHDAPDAVVGMSQNYLSPDLTEAEAASIRAVTRPLRAELLPATLLRADAFRRVGPLDEGLRTGSAIDWISRARLAGLTFAHVEQVVLRRRLHASNLGRSRQVERNADLLRVVRDHHARHRST